MARKEKKNLAFFFFLARVNLLMKLATGPAVGRRVMTNSCRLNLTCTTGTEVSNFYVHTVLSVCRHVRAYCGEMNYFGFAATKLFLVRSYGRAFDLKILFRFRK